MRRLRRRPEYLVKHGILIDTTHLLPLFGVDVGLSGYGEAFPRLLEEYRVYYTPLPLTEAKWIVLKISRMKPELSDKILLEYRKRLDTIISNDKLEETIMTNDVKEEVTDHLLRMGFARLLRQDDLCYSIPLQRYPFNQR